MKFVYCGYDFMLGAVQRLLDDGHRLAGVFTFECDNIFNFNRETLALAKEHKALAIVSPPQDIHIDSFLAKDVECFLSAGYPYKIPPIDEARAYGINMHPSLLPKGRGLMPSPQIILKDHDAAGITVHKLSAVFDDGDILYQEALPLHPRETVETYSARIGMRAPDILSNVFSDLPNLWVRAKPQDRKKASRFPLPKDDMRMLDWNRSVADLDKIGRAFGRFGSLAQLGGKLFVIYAFDTWSERHSFKPGTITLHQPRDIVVAVKDGFVCLKDFQEAKI